jgi:predicted metal-dependent phosphoesterase TrpH
LRYDLLKYDLHVHSKYSSDGYLEPKKLVKVAQKRGLSGIAVTDHNTLKGGLKTKEYETDDFQIMVGAEINTDRGEVIGLFLEEEIKGKNFLEVVEEIKSQNGIVIIPHPFDELRGNGIRPKPEDSKLVDGVEVFNSRCLRREYNHKAQKYAVKCGLNSVAGSDAHFANEIGKAGIITSHREVRELLLRGDINIFGEKSNFLNLGLTKVLKIWRKGSSG